MGRNRFDYLLEVESEDAVRRVTPDFAALARVDARGVIVTSRASTPGFDFVSRFFAPRVGVNEDPVTGSAHCTLAPFWAARLGKPELVAYQASPYPRWVQTLDQLTAGLSPAAKRKLWSENARRFYRLD